MGSVLEIGANVVINLHGLRRMQPDSRKLSLNAIEPNPETFAELMKNSELGLDQAQCCDCYKLPFADQSFDLVYTCGVLIHIPPERLEDAMREITRVSKRFLLCAEYFSHVPEEIVYHGQKGLLWKRDFGGKYLDTLPSLSLRKYGFVWMREFPHYDDLNWWMLEKILD